MMRILLFIAIVSIGLISCGGGDDCTPETIVGTYTGNNSCDDPNNSGVDLNEGEITFTIAHLGENNYSATDQNGDVTVFTIDGCSIDVPVLEFEFFGIMRSTSGDGKFDGDQLTLNVITGVDEVEFTCNFIGTKQ